MGIADKKLNDNGNTKLMPKNNVEAVIKRHIA
jgi:hypothetical protein